MEYWKKDMLDFSYFTEREGNDSQRLVRVEKVRQKWRESELVLEQTDLKAIGQDWRSWSVEGGEKEVARWIKENAEDFELFEEVQVIEAFEQCLAYRVYKQI